MLWIMRSPEKGIRLKRQKSEIGNDEYATKTDG